MTITVTLRYGATKSITVEVQEPITIGQLISDASRRAVLGYPENVAAVVDGETVSMDTYIADGDEILLEKQAASKAT